MVNLLPKANDGWAHRFRHFTSSAAAITPATRFRARRPPARRDRRRDLVRFVELLRARDERACRAPRSPQPFAETNRPPDRAKLRNGTPKNQLYSGFLLSSADFFNDISYIELCGTKNNVHAQVFLTRKFDAETVATGEADALLHKIYKVVRAEDRPPTDDEPAAIYMLRRRLNLIPTPG